MSRSSLNLKLAVGRLEIGESVPPHPCPLPWGEGEPAGRVHGRNARQGMSRSSLNLKFAVGRLAIGESVPPHPCPLPWGEGEPVGRAHGRNARQKASMLSITSARRSRIRSRKARDPSPKPRLVT